MNDISPTDLKTILHSRRANIPDEDEVRLVTHRIEDKLEKAGQSPYVEAACYDIPFGLSTRLVPWGMMDFSQLMERLRKLAEAEDLSLYDAARKFTTVQVRSSDQGWLWHPWLGITPRQ